MKPKVLLFAGYYLPGVKGGGPIVSIKNMVEALSDKIDFYVVAEDRDLGDSNPYPNIERRKWLHKDNCKVYYVNSKQLSFSNIKKLLEERNYTYVYLNSFFDFNISIKPLLIHKMCKCKSKVILAPRGNFSEGALNLKAIKKKLFISLSKFLKINKFTIWHATADTELADIKKIFGKEIEYQVASNLPMVPKPINKCIKKKENSLEIIFISRIHPKKNLLYAIKLLKSIKGNVQFNIYGPIEDEKYWRECLMEISKLPKKIKCNYKGLLSHDEVQKAFQTNHLFLFPTLGENYGHVIAESLSNGCPVIVSDQTPWKNLELNQCGADIALCDEKKFIEIINNYIKMNEIEYSQKALNSIKYFKGQSNFNEIKCKYEKLFEV